MSVCVSGVRVWMQTEPSTAALRRYGRHTPFLKPSMPNTRLHVVNRPKPDEIAHAAASPTAANLQARCRTPYDKTKLQPPPSPSLPAFASPPPGTAMSPQKDITSLSFRATPLAPRLVGKHERDWAVASNLTTVGRHKPRLSRTSNSPLDPNLQRHSSLNQWLPKQSLPSQVSWVPGKFLLTPDPAVCCLTLYQRVKHIVSTGTAHRQQSGSTSATGRKNGCRARMTSTP